MTKKDVISKNLLRQTIKLMIMPYDTKGMLTWRLGTPGEYSGFQVTGMIEDFFRFEIFDFGIFMGRKILASIFFGSLIWVFKTI